MILMLSSPAEAERARGARGSAPRRQHRAATSAEDTDRARGSRGHTTREIARDLDTTPTTVSLWRGRFAREGLGGLNDLPRSGTPPIYTEATDTRIRAVLDRPPPKGFARWNGPLIAKALGDVDVQYVWRSLRKQKIDLGGRKSWCESNDPEFAAKAADVVGLYMAPPDKASSSVSTKSRRSRRWSARKAI